jgi:hypothetical protein
VADFLRTTVHAVRSQVWTGLLAYLPLRCPMFLSHWRHSFSRLFALIRAGLWKRCDVLSFVRSYGTADGHFRYLASPEYAYLPGWG